HALRAALDIVRLVDAMDKRWQAQGRRSIQVGIGINSGKVIAGDAGYNERREFTVVGPETLLAARLQEATNELNAFIIASAATCDVVRDVFSLVPIKGHPLPGIKRLADAFIVRGLKRLDRDDLIMPREVDFPETRAVAPPPAPPPEPPAPPPPAPPPPEPPRATVVRETPPPPDPAPLPRVDLPDPAQPLRPRRRTTSSSSPMDLPELRIPRYIDDGDIQPIMPDPPAPRATYEDDEGPPHQLPP